MNSDWVDLGSGTIYISYQTINVGMDVKSDMINIGLYLGRLIKFLHFANFLHTKKYKTDHII